MIEQIVKIAKKNSFVTWFRNKFPRLFLYTVVKPLTAVRYTNAKKGLKNKLSTTNNDPSVLLFTTHKCASTYTTKIIKQLVGYRETTCVDYEAYFSVKSIEPKPYFKKNGKQLFKPKGYYYGPLREYYPINDLNKYKLILVLRDPRDVLTSFYYSKKYSHIVISDEFNKEREYYANHTIDEFVIEYLPIVKGVYQSYVDNLLHNELVCNIPYELMVLDFNKWLDKLIGYLNIDDIPQDILQELKQNEQSTQGSGDVNQHIRAKLPGDYKIKLKPETIAYINTELNDILQILNYL